MADQSPRRRTATLFAVVALAGIVAGAGAVYVMRSGDGNGGDSTDTAEVDCSSAVAAGKRVDPFAKGEVAAFSVASNPDYLGDLKFLDPDGGETTLASFAGKTALVNLWATWCVPCRTEMPALDRLEAALGSDDFEVVAINIDLDNEERARAFLDEIEVKSLGFYSDPSTDVFNALKKRGLALGLPTTLLVDGKGCRIGSVQGPAEWDSPDAKALIGAALGG
ncbi:MAG: TlpA family protein disulfide reductase [Bauldia sp.]|nr:TlpA family protein disulfide reductase [Bauldia sp.]